MLHWPRWSRSIVLVALLSAPGLARAQAANPGGAPTAVSAASLTAERQKVRTELDRVNAEIDALKHDKRGLREDYQLRARMADAEALAQRLTDLDVRIERLNPAGRRTDPQPLAAAPEARPSDDRAALEAKADILSDQARRLQNQADLLAGRVTELRGRQELRRRAGQLERDPFSPLEQSKRRSTAVALSAGAKDVGAPGTVAVPPGRGPTEGGTGTAGGSTSTPTTGTGTPTTPGNTGITGGASDAAKIATTGATQAPTAVPVGGSAAGTPTDAPGSVAGQFRGILDAATLSEIRRLESGGAPGSNLQAMERALSALRERAAHLNANAATLRTRAKTAP